MLGAGVSILDQDRTREFLFDAVRKGRRGHVTITGVHGVSEAQKDPELRGILHRALLVAPENVP